jgi:hypothetical protein
MHEHNNLNGFNVQAKAILVEGVSCQRAFVVQGHLSAHEEAPDQCDVVYWEACHTLDSEAQGLQPNAELLYTN